MLHDSDVHAFGITDYFSIDAFVVCVNHYKNRYPESAKFFLPNVELRSSDVINQELEEVNIHVLFNPAVPDFIAQAKSFLAHLATNRTVANGRVVKASELCTKQDFESATTTRSAIVEALRHVYGEDADLLEYVFILTAANNDGLRAPRGKKRKELLSDELDKFSNGFLGSAKNVEYFLNSSRLDDKTLVAEKKPVFSGCDAHSFEDIDAYLGKVAVSDGAKREPTWIKADLTYEGLKQTTFEPAERVFIGPEPEIEVRIRQNETRYIKSLTITCKPGYADSCGKWFKDEHIPLNKELVAIIGNKGSGKSALADITGLLGNSHNQMSKSQRGSPERLFSFLNEQKFLKGGYASNFMAELHWYSGSVDKRSLDAQSDLALPEKVEYLPQKYLERICANVEYSEFEKTLNEVIFGYVREAELHGRRTFDELIEYLSQQIDENIRKVQQELHVANEKVIELERKLTPAYRKELEERIRLKREELASHSAQPPSEKPKPPDLRAEAMATSSPLELLEAELEQLKVLIEDLAKERKDESERAQKLRHAKQAIEREVRSVAAIKEQFGLVLRQSGVEIDRVLAISFDPESLDAAITQAAQRIAEIDRLLVDEADIGTIVGTTEQSSAREASLVCRQDSLQKKKSTLIEQLGKPEREYQTYLQERAFWDQRGREILGEELNPAQGTLRDLQAEMRRIESSYAGELVNARATRDEVSLRVFEEKRGLTKFYNSVKSAIDSEIRKNGADLGDYAIAIQAGLSFESKFFDEFLAHIAQNAKGSFYGKEDGRAALHRIAAKVSDWEDESQVLSFLREVIEALHNDKRPDLRDTDRARSVVEQLRDRKTVSQLYDYLFGFDYLRPKYELKVDEKDLSELSPGERGGLLLVFYLMLDRRDIPLIIDQPEDNLDNKSVYEILVKFLMKAKKRRQILIVTHNPNLAVVADAEQIIHVSIDKKDANDFSFVSGSIEDPVTNALVLDILEGTRPAFDNRRLKYRKAGSQFR
jgi:predicted ATPase